MLRALVFATALTAASPSLATEWVNCADADNAASFSFLAGTLDVLSISGLTVSVGDKVWASDLIYGPGDPVTVGQAFEDEHQILIDAMNGDVSAKVAELRLFKAAEGDAEPVYAGTLRLPGYGVWAVSCSGT